MLHAISFTLFLLFPAGLAAGEPVDYSRDIKPILTRHCIGCHGADKHRSGLRLDAGQLIYQGRQ